MEVQATYKYAKISPFKAREVTREIQGLPVSAALDVVAYSPKKAAALVNKTLKSAVANAENNASSERPRKRGRRKKPLPIEKREARRQRQTRRNQLSAGRRRKSETLSVCGKASGAEKFFDSSAPGVFA